MKFKKSYLMMAPAIVMGAQATLATAAQLEEVVVTATKRATSEMDTPLSMEVVTGDAIANSGIVNMQDLSVSVPNVNIGDGQITGSIYMRGMGSGTDRSFEQSVAMFIDGVYMPRSRQYRAPFFDIDRVEVMRGPQAVLYGLNATAGTISVISSSTNPGDESFLELMGEYEFEYSGYRTSVVTGGSLGDSVGGRLAVRYSDQGDGFYENTSTGKDEGAEEETIVRGTLVWDISDNLRMNAKLSYADVEMDGSLGESFSHLSKIAGSDGKLDWKRQTGTLPLLETFTGKDNGYLEHEVINASLNFEYSMDNHDFTAVIGYSDSSWENAWDVSVLGLPFFSAIYEEDYEQVNVELRLASNPENTFSYIAGLYWDDSDNDQLIPTPVDFGAFQEAGIAPSPLPGPFTGINDVGGNEAGTTTISPFFTGTWLMSDAWRLTAGLRYSDVEKTLTRLADPADCELLIYQDPENWINVGSLGFCLSNFTGKQDDFTSDNWMGEAILHWDISADSTSYAKIGQSVKSGGHTFATSVPAEDYLTYDDETATTIELGYKAMFLDDRLQLNAALFYTEYEDLQVNAFVSVDGIPQSTITNAGESEASGLELELNYAAADWLTVGGSVGWLDHEYTDYDNGACAVGEVPDQPDGSSCSKTGRDVPFSPEYSGSVFADLGYPITANMLLTGGLTFSFSDGYYGESTLDDEVAQDSYTRVDARIGLAESDYKWSVSLIGKNLTEEAIIAQSQGFAFFGMGYIGAPRTVALQAKYNF